VAVPIISDCPRNPPSQRRNRSRGSSNYDTQFIIIIVYNIFSIKLFEQRVNGSHNIIIQHAEAHEILNNPISAFFRNTNLDHELRITCQYLY